MKNLNLRVLLSLITLYSLFLAATAAPSYAAPVRFEQVQQVVNVKPGRANTGGFTQLRLSDDGVLNVDADGDDDDDDKTVTQPQQDDRVITTTTTTIEEEGDCNCDQPVVKKGFPKWAFLGLAAIPLLFLIGRDRDKTPTPTMTPPITGTPTMTPTMTSTPTETPTPKTPTPTPHEPVPEPMTIPLFGTGLASIGLAARRRLRKRGDNTGGEEDQETE